MPLRFTPKTSSGRPLCGDSFTWDILGQGVVTTSIPHLDRTLGSGHFLIQLNGPSPRPAALIYSMWGHFSLQDVPVTPVYENAGSVRLKVVRTDGRFARFFAAKSLGISALSHGK